MLYGGFVTLSVKDIRLKVIPSKLANEFVREHHYSGKVVPNSKLHFGAFYNNILHGVMSFGSPLDKRKVIGLVRGTKWNEMMELNRMVFDDTLPTNSESRCISIAFKLLKKNAPHIKWVLSYADGTQCGDGTIYRASGFSLTNIGKNSTIGFSEKLGEIVAKHGKEARKQGRVKLLKGFQLRYIYFIDKKKSRDLTVPIIPFSKIKEVGASMYKGKRLCLVGETESHLVTNEKLAVQTRPQGSI